MYKVYYREKPSQAIKVLYCNEKDYKNICKYIAKKKYNYLYSTIIEKNTDFFYKKINKNLENQENSMSVY